MSIPKDTIKRALLLSEGKEIVVEIADSKKLTSFRTALYKAKKEFDKEDEIYISSSSNKIILSKDKSNEEDFGIVITEVDVEDEKTKKEDKTIQVDIDPARIKTIREALAYYDPQKQALAEQFRECKRQIEEVEELSVEERNFLISRSLELTNFEMEKLNKKARLLSLSTKK